MSHACFLMLWLTFCVPVMKNQITIALCTVQLISPRRLNIMHIRESTKSTSIPMLTVLNLGSRISRGTVSFECEETRYVWRAFIIKLHFNGVPLDSKILVDE